jgi:hypothetical protein
MRLAAIPFTLMPALNVTLCLPVSNTGNVVGISYVPCRLPSMLTHTSAMLELAAP